MTGRGWSTPPDALKLLIASVNDARELPDLAELIPDSSDLANCDWRDPWNPLARACRRVSEKLSAAARKIVGSPKEFDEFRRNYTFLVSGRSVVTELARQYRSRTASRGLLTAHEERFSANLEILIVENENGKLELLTDRLSRALIGLPVDRIRMCAVCDRLFWARRVNSECCGESCRKTYNQRNSRTSQRLRRMKRR